MFWGVFLPFPSERKTPKHTLKAKTYHHHPKIPSSPPTIPPITDQETAIEPQPEVEMLHTQLDDFLSDSIPLLLLYQIARTFCQFRSLLLAFLQLLGLVDPRGFPEYTTAARLDSSLLASISLGLAGLVVLAESLESNRVLSQRFDPGREGAFRRDCAVCMSEIREGEQVRVLGCRHVYHKGCLDQCLHHHVLSCPLCKRPMVSTPAAAAPAVM